MVKKPKLYRESVQPNYPYIGSGKKTFWTCILFEDIIWSAWGIPGCNQLSRILHSILSFCKNRKYDIPDNFCKFSLTFFPWYFGAL